MVKRKPFVLQYDDLLRALSKREQAELCFKVMLISHGHRKGVVKGILAPLDFETWYFPITFLVEKFCPLSFELVNWSFTTFPPGKILFATPGKIHYRPSPGKILPTPMWPKLFCKINIRNRWKPKRKRADKIRRDAEQVTSDAEKAQGALRDAEACLSFRRRYVCSRSWC